MAGRGIRGCFVGCLEKVLSPEGGGALSIPTREWGMSCQSSGAFGQGGI